MDIELQDIVKAYPSPAGLVRAVDGVNLHIAEGEFFFLLGPSGCGKTTLLRMIAGLVEPTAGRVLFDARDVTNESVEGRRTAMVFQNYALWPHMTVQQNVEFGPQMRGLGRGERTNVATDTLRRVEMESFGSRKPGQLSGGQQQRVALARALAAQGKCLLLDEPLSNLDARLRLHMRGQLRQIVKSAGLTAVYVTHDQKEALSMADRIAVMSEGRVVQVGTPQEVYNRPASRFVADFLGEANFIEGVVASAGPLAQVSTPAGTISSRSSNNAPPGTAVIVCVRPERISIRTESPRDAARGRSEIGARDASGEQSPVNATVASSTYLGELRQYICTLENGAPWRVSSLADTSEGIAPGTKVQLRMSAADVAILTK